MSNLFIYRDQLTSANKRSLVHNVPYELVQHEDFLHRQNLRNKYICLNDKKKMAIKAVDSPKSNTDGEALDLPQVVLFQPSNVHMGWLKKFPVGAGMINVGNTCFINATLQVRFSFLQNEVFC